MRPSSRPSTPPPGKGVVELDDARLRFAHPLLASICYEQAPIWKRRAIHGALARAVADVEERARHMALSVGRSRRRRRLVPRRGRRAGGSSRGDRGGSRALRARSRPDTRRSCLWSGNGGCVSAKFHRLAGDSARAVLLLERILTEVPEGLERSDVLFELASTLRADPQTTIERLDQALTNAAGDEIATGADPRVPGLDPGLPGRHRRGARRYARGAREGRAHR